MNRKRLLWLLAVVAVMVLVAVQVTTSSMHRSEFIANADLPTVAPGVDVLAGIAVIPLRIRQYDYRRDAFGDSWTDDNPAPGGHNGCDTRNDVLTAQLAAVQYRGTSKCVVIAGTLLADPYTGRRIEFRDQLVEDFRLRDAVLSDAGAVSAAESAARGSAATSAAAGRLPSGRYSAAVHAAATPAIKPRSSTEMAGLRVRYLTLLWARRAFGLLVLVMAAAISALDPPLLWERLDRRR